MFIARANHPVFDTALKCANTIVGAPIIDLSLVRVLTLVFPDGRIYWGEQTPEFVDAARIAWEKDLTEDQIQRYGVAAIQLVACTTWMYPQDYAQVRSEL